MEKLSVILKKLRESKNMTIEELAKNAGIGKGTVGDIETNRSKSTVKTLNKISKALNLTIEEKNLLDSSFLGRTVAGNSDPSSSNLNLNKREKLQYDDFMSSATLMFNDESISDEDKEKLFRSLQELFFETKLLNKKKKSELK
ncbi:MAG: helix-turn-helix domain-containing protein [Fusobacteriaceae bacterium]